MATEYSDRLYKAVLLSSRKVLVRGSSGTNLQVIVLVLVLGPQVLVNITVLSILGLGLLPIDPVGQKKN